MTEIDTGRVRWLLLCSPDTCTDKCYIHKKAA